MTRAATAPPPSPDAPRQDEPRQSSAGATAGTVPPPQRRRTARDLARAAWLRPRDIFELYGIPPSTLGDLANHADTARRPPSRFIRGRGGRRGIRLFDRAAFEAWLARWTAEGDFREAQGTPRALSKRSAANGESTKPKRAA